MGILENVIQQVQKENARSLEEFQRTRGNPALPLFVSPITRNTLNNIYNIINSQEFIKKREMLPGDNLDVIIDSSGGDADAAYHIAKLLHRSFKGEIAYIVPRFAKSAATLLVCGGNSIVMGPTSELGPMDPQILLEGNEHISAKAVQATLELIKEYTETDLKLASIIASRINPLVMGQYQSTLEIAREYQRELLFLRMFRKGPDNEQKVGAIVNKFAEGYTHHSRIIDFEEAGEFCLNIDYKTDREWKSIWDIYMGHTQFIYMVKVMKILERSRDQDL